MRRDTFLKTLAALAATGTLPAAWAQPGANLKMLIPANPGGGWTPPAARWARPCWMPSRPPP